MSDSQQWSDLASLLPPQCNAILDIGCGNGQTLALCPDVSYRAGIDIDQAVISAASARIPDAEFFVAQGEALPFPDDRFDAVISCVALPYMDISAVFRECARVMRPGGVLYISVHSWEFLMVRWAANPPNLAGRVFRVYVALNGLCFHLFGKVFRYPLRPSYMESYQTEHALRHSLEKSGFGKFRNLSRPIPSFSAVLLK